MVYRFNVCLWHPVSVVKKLPSPDDPFPGPAAGALRQGPVHVPGVVVDQLRQDGAACGGLAAGR